MFNKVLIPISSEFYGKHVLKRGEFLADNFNSKIDLIYIDPPFNTGKREFLYKNDYLISSWLTMMENRVKLAKNILHKNGNIFVRIDNNGNHFVRFLLDLIFDKSNFRNEIIINKTKAKKQRKNLLYNRLKVSFSILKVITIISSH